MPQNTRHRMTQTSFLYTLLMIFLFAAVNAAVNPVETLAKDAENSLHPAWFSPAGIAPVYRCSAKNQSSNCKSTAVLSAAGLKMVDLVNQERMDAGLAKLEVDASLVRLAEEKGRDMVRFNYFGHYSKNLGTIYDQLEQTRYPYQLAAENLIGAPNYRRAEQCVISSPAHRSNILNPHFRKIGIGIIHGGPYGEMIVQLFTG